MSMPGSRVRASFCFAIPLMLGSVKASFSARSLAQGIPLLKDNQFGCLFLFCVYWLKFCCSEWKKYFHATSAVEILVLAKQMLK